MKTLLIVLLISGSAIVIALLIAALFGVHLIEEAFSFFEGEDND